MEILDTSSHSMFPHLDRPLSPDRHEVCFGLIAIPGKMARQGETRATVWWFAGRISRPRVDVQAIITGSMENR